MTRSEIRAQRERVARAFRYVMRKLEQAFDLRIETVGCHADNQMETSALCWPNDPRLFQVAFDPSNIAKMSRQKIRHTALHEVYHMMTWPWIEDACRGMSAAEAKAYIDRVVEPATEELTRRTAPYIIGEIKG